MASLKKRGKYYWAQFYIGGKQKRVSLQTTSGKVAAEKLRRRAGGGLRPMRRRQSS